MCVVFQQPFPPTQHRSVDIVLVGVGYDGERGAAQRAETVLSPDHSVAPVYNGDENADILVWEVAELHVGALSANEPPDATSGRPGARARARCLRGGPVGAVVPTQRRRESTAQGRALPGDVAPPRRVARPEVVAKEASRRQIAVTAHQTHCVHFEALRE